MLCEYIEKKGVRTRSWRTQRLRPSVTIQKKSDDRNN